MNDQKRKPFKNKEPDLLTRFTNILPKSGAATAAEALMKKEKEKKALEKRDQDVGHGTVALKHGSAGKGGTYSPTKEEMESEFLDSLKPKTPPKPKPKPKDKKKMGGGKVYKRKAGGGVKTGKVIKTNMTGEQLVAACYGNKSV